MPIILFLSAVPECISRPFTTPTSVRTHAFRVERVFRAKEDQAKRENLVLDPRVHTHTHYTCKRRLSSTLVRVCVSRRHYRVSVQIIIIIMRERARLEDSRTHEQSSL